MKILTGNNNFIDLIIIKFQFYQRYPPSLESVMEACSAGKSNYEPTSLVEAFHKVPHVDINLKEVPDDFDTSLDYFQVRSWVLSTIVCYRHCATLGRDNMGLRSPTGVCLCVYINVCLLHRCLLLLLLPAQEKSFKIC